MATAAGPVSVFDAGLQLVTDSLNICSQAAALGLRRPTERPPSLLSLSRQRVGVDIRSTA